MSPPRALERRRPASAAATATVRASESDVDVVVIGGGVNGTGVARDAAMRGLRVALLERHDFGFGASGNSSGMIHGGPRYLLHDPGVTRTSCLDSGHIQRIAPHLLFRIPFLAPVMRGRFDWAWSLGMDGFFEAYDRYQPLKRGKRHVMLTAEEALAIEPGLTRSLHSAVTFDEWGIDGARLCVANAVDAEERGARILVGSTAECIERDESGRVRAVSYLDRETGSRGRLTTRAVVNATGAWAPLTGSLAGLAPVTTRLRPGKGIHVVFDRRLSNYAVVAEAIDGRQIFFEPWQNVSFLGTTDDDYYGDLDDVRATSEEVRYLVEGVARVFPIVSRARVIHTYAGVRPTLYEHGPIEDKLSRDHRIVDHSEHGAPGIYSMIGGKLASYRLFAEMMADVLARELGATDRGTSHLAPLPGGDEVVSAEELAQARGLDLVTARRLTYRHGSRARRIAERIARRPTEARLVCLCEPVTEAEVRYVVRHEHARSVSDVARRTRLGLGSCGGMRCACRCASIVADERRASPIDGMTDALRFIHRQARTRVVALGPDQARQEALAIAHLRAQIGLGPVHRAMSVASASLPADRGDFPTAQSPAVGKAPDAAGGSRSSLDAVGKAPDAAGGSRSSLDAVGKAPDAAGGSRSSLDAAATAASSADEAAPRAGPASPQSMGRRDV